MNERVISADSLPSYRKCGIKLRLSSIGCFHCEHANYSMKLRPPKKIILMK